ncbi:glycoside hydrolase family 2 protein [Amniculicola lignicola CBS 123094]|uniref:Glycoside hydrolase family 2 protein n=1 Tax=Amniculicola lignicola CBS 123094 TaxID=1392246 RepID=A0A6A5X572_9PLEO|nr:glycoside hydrolase family 2 protein [Amniculicola lignicola CBS 123094]
MRPSISTLVYILAGSVLAKSIPPSSERRSLTRGEYALKEGPLDTDWTNKVGTNPWPEYPRPQLARSKWKTLNGLWGWRNASSGRELDNPPFGVPLDQPVLVPFCLESALSGVMGEYHIWSWYETTFNVPSDWSGHITLNFGAVDHTTTVFVNRRKVGEHVGGYWSFSFDITQYLNEPGQTNELLVFVYDPTTMDGTQIVSGKQNLQSKRFDHIFYTPCSGIWQTVWLEAVPTEYITQLDVSAAADGKVNATVHNSGTTSLPVDITIYEPYSTDVKAQAIGKSGNPFQFMVESPKVWSPNTPTLYNISVKMGDDIVQSYTGFRTVSRGVINGVQRPLLNGEFVFQFGTLDQGFWPDGIYTPPSHEAMVYDLLKLKEVGFNMLRKHIKVETALFYKACDELGLMLIQDMPSLSPWRGLTAVNDFTRELDILIEQHKSYPSIVSWMLYNEGWGQPGDNGKTEHLLTDRIRQLDPTRLVNSVSGWHDHVAGDFSDNHHYASAQCGMPLHQGTTVKFYDKTRIGIQGEFGGIGTNVSEANLWKVPAAVAAIDQTYEMADDIPTWNFRAHWLLKELEAQIATYACSAAVWTQTTDVEGEVNGLLTYDRRVIRMDIEQWKDDIQAMYKAAEGRGKQAAPMD